MHLRRADNRSDPASLPVRPGVRRAGLPRLSPPLTPASGAPERAALISTKANSVARRAESIPCAWKVRCQLVRVAPYWPEWRSFGTSGLVTGITVTR